MAKRGHRSPKGLLLAVAAVLAGGAVLISGASLAQPMAVVSDAAIEVEGERTQFIMTVDRSVNFKVFALADPYRVIIDMEEVEFELPDDAGEQGAGLVNAYRFGLFSPGRSRIVIDAGAPVEMAEPEIRPGGGGEPTRLVVGLGATSRERFLKEFALNGGQGEAPPRAAPPPQRAKPNEKPVIVIDPGHGGIDSGARSVSGVLEKDIVLAFAESLRDRLRSNGRFAVVMTRSGDEFLSLNDRRAVAREHNADLFVSIHADSIRRSGIRGATVYTLSERASDEEAAALAAQENRSDAIAGVPLEDYSDAVGNILFDLASRFSKKASRQFAQSLVEEMRGHVRLNKNPVRSAGFVVLKEHIVPSVLVELGYLSNQQDERAMRSTDWREGASGAIAGAINDYFATKVAGTN